MMRWIIGSSMKIRLVVVSVAVLLIIFGVTQLRKVPVDILPEFSRPYVEIQTEALGLSAVEVEALITTPLEADMLNGVAWVDEIRSESIPGLSSIVLIFEMGTDIMAARQMVQERLVSVFALPNVSKAPVMLNPVSSTSRCMMIGLTSEELSNIEISVLARWTMLPRLMGVPGVANVSIWGYRDRQLQVQVDPKRLQENGVSLNQIISTTGNALWVSPLSFLNASTPGTGGFFDTPNQRLGIRHILPITTAQELSRVVVDGTKLSLGEVTEVVEDHQPLIGDAIVDESSNLILIVEKFPWANTIEVTEGVEDALSGLRPGLSGLVINSSLFRPATFIEAAVSNLTETLLIGAFLMLLALFAFFIDWRLALVCMTAMLLSIIISLGVLQIQGVTINMMIIAGIIIALGALVDDAIIDLENIKRKIALNKEHDQNKSIGSIIFEATVEKRTPIIYATPIILIAVLPVFFLQGVTGAFFKSIAVAYILAILASFVISITLTPSLMYFLFKNFPTTARESYFKKWLLLLYDKLFLKAVRVPRPIFVTSCLIVVAVIIGFITFQQQTIDPTFKETDLIVRWEAPPGISQLAMNRVLKLVCEELDELDGVDRVSGLVGRAIMSDMVTNVNIGQLCVSLKSSDDYDKTFNQIKDVVSSYPGISQEVLTYSQSEVRKELLGTDESFVVRVYGEDWNIMRNKAEELQKILSGIDGIVNSKVHYPDVEPTLLIEVDLEAVKNYGLKPGDVRRQTTSLVSGLGVGNLFDEQKVFDVVVWGKPSVRNNLSNIQNLLIETSAGGVVPLKEIASIQIVPEVTNIRRESIARFIDLSATISGRSIPDVLSDVTGIINNVKFPLEYRAELLGEYAERLDSQQRMLGFLIAALILIFLLLQAVFRSWKLAIAVFCTLPLAFGGAIIANLLGFGNVLSLGSLIGFITIFGIATRNSITLIRRLRNLESENEGVFSLPLVEIGTRERVLPVIITALIVFLAFLPMLVVGNIAGLEILHSTAVVIIGGLITTTIYTLIVIPAIYVMFGSSREPELDLGLVMLAVELDSQ